MSALIFDPGGIISCKVFFEGQEGVSNHHTSRPTSSSCNSVGAASSMPTRLGQYATHQCQFWAAALFCTNVVLVVMVQQLGRREREHAANDESHSIREAEIATSKHCEVILVP